MTTSQQSSPFTAAVDGVPSTAGGLITTSTGSISGAGVQKTAHLHHQQQQQTTTTPATGTQSQQSASKPVHHHDSLQKDAATASTPTPADLLTFSDVSSDISQLHFDNSKSPPTSRPVSASSNSSRLNSQPAPPPASASAIRKTSPGLAARLKALGFGTAKKPAPPATPPLSENIGRLDESQIRQLDEKHQAASSNSVIVRRGRPWKGAGAISDRFSSTARKLQPPEPDIDAESLNAEESQFLPSPQSDPDLDSRPQLPEIRTPEPLVMDTQKYRLPDHTNGNGTKATPDLRREHIEREARPTTTEQDVDTPPPPPPKATPPPVTPPATSESSDYVPGLNSYFTPGHNRPGSIYTLSRASFANQLAQLTSLQLPDAESLSSKVSAIPTAQLAAKALINAADQIRSWISKASEVISGLDSDDDVEWSAAGGREGLAEVESAIVRFEELINVYVSAIEELQTRKDISDVPTTDLQRAVAQMESIVGEWTSIRSTLQNVREQVEIAMEWEELWNNVLGDIQGEMDELSRLVFEMEERRHKSIAAAASGESVDIGDLETIVEDTPPQASKIMQSRLSIPSFPMSPSSPGTPSLSQDDSSLLALFARMQPLRASLDFLPMRLSVFQNRAEHSFPTACDELEMRQTGLDASYKKLEKDAESLRKELGEDRWVIVFRGAGRQAQKMHESVERSLVKLKESIDAGHQVNNPSVLTKKLESYEAKKTHYGPAIERVLSIIDKGVKDRLTVNGEILRLHLDLEARWASLKKQTREMDSICEDLHAERRGQQLRDSVSSMLSNDRSTVGSGQETPGSSPPSSVIMSSLGIEPYTPNPKTRSSSVHSNAASGRRQSSLPAPASSGKRAGSRLSMLPGSSSSTTPVPPSRLQRPSSTIPTRPKWNGSTNTTGIDTGHNFKPMNLTTPSPYSKQRSPMSQRSASAVTPGSSSASKLPTFRSPLGRSTSESPQVNDTPTRTGHSRLSFRERLASPRPPSQQGGLLQKPRLSAQSSTTSSSNRRASFQPPRSNSGMDDAETSRPASSLASSSRRTSLLPAPRARRESSTGRSSPQALAASRLAMRKKETQPKDNRPVWRP